jgi:hypothetical protein
MLALVAIMIVARSSSAICLCRCSVGEGPSYIAGLILLAAARREQVILGGQADADEVALDQAIGERRRRSM